jgi:hypothetical protein
MFIKLRKWERWGVCQEWGRRKQQTNFSWGNWRKEIDWKNLK